jgi:rieske iron-sulfur protein
MRDPPAHRLNAAAYNPLTRMTDVNRRTILIAGMGLALGQTDAAASRPRAGDLLVKAGDASKAPLASADIRPGAQTLAWPMDPDGTLRSASRLNQVLLIRLDVATLSPETKARAADGVVAYSSICTHTGCDVDDWDPAARVLACQCHSSQFDPRDGARVVDGPAPRPLPALPLTIVGGVLAVAQPFTAPIAFEKG